MMGLATIYMVWPFVLLLSNIIISICLATWVYKDSKSKDNDKSFLWLLAVLFTSFIGFLAYIIVEKDSVGKVKSKGLLIFTLIVFIVGVIIPALFLTSTPLISYNMFNRDIEIEEFSDIETKLSDKKIEWIAKEKFSGKSTEELFLDEEDLNKNLKINIDTKKGQATIKISSGTKTIYKASESEDIDLSSLIGADDLGKPIYISIFGDYFIGSVKVKL